MEWKGRIITGSAAEALKGLPDGSAHCCVTSPPYWGLRDYGIVGQIGLEATPGEYMASLMAVFAEVRRVLRPDGTFWLNLGDSRMGKAGPGLKAKDLMGMPWTLAFALRDAGWFLRSDIIWHKTNASPESVKDRPTDAHEYLFLLSKSREYFYDSAAIKVRSTRMDKRRVNMEQARVRRGLPERQPNSPGKCQAAKKGTLGTPGDFLCNRRSVWQVSYPHNIYGHVAAFPPELVRPCIRAGCPAGGVVLDPFFGSGTVGQVCIEEGRGFIGIEINPEYVEIAKRRLAEAERQGRR